MCHCAKNLLCPTNIFLLVLLFTATQLATLTNSIQAELTDQSELSDQYEDSVTFDNFDYAVNINLNVIGTIDDSKEKSHANTLKQDLASHSNKKSSKRRNKSSVAKNGS